MSEDKYDLIFNWFHLNLQHKWNAYFLRFLNRKDQLVLLHFEELEMDIAIHIDKIDEWDFGERLIVTIIDSERVHNFINFKLH